MLIACIVVICLLVVFVAVTFFITFKKYSFELEGGNLKVQTIGSHLKIYFNNELIKDVFSPQLFNGEKVEFQIGEKEYNLFCKCNSVGNKLKVEILDGEKVVAENGVQLKEKNVEEKK